MITLRGYQILAQIHDSSRSQVYRGIRSSDQKPVVLKLLKSEYPTFNELVQFRNQYTITKNLDLAEIVKPIALENYRNGFALIMEDFGGIPLQEEMRRCTDKGMGECSNSLNKFFNIAIQVVQILEGLNRNRIIHKDIKPQNILINPQTQQIKLIDFSIASLLPKENQEIINPNVLEGTLAYMSPEQTGRMNRGIDYRTDFYSLGVSFYEVLTGQLPFRSNDPMEVVHCHIAKIPTPPIELVPAIPKVVSDIVMKLMAKTAEERYQSASGLRVDLETCWQQWQEKGSINQFPLGERDICDRFVIPEKLYGREAEVATLLAAFDRIAGREGQGEWRNGEVGEWKSEKSPIPNPQSKIQNLKSKIEMMLVAGFSGIGKTAVVNEVHKPIVQQRGYFIKGKFDQFKRDIPFSAWVQAFQNLMQQLLTESTASLAKWKANILEALRENAQVIIDVIPELELLIGKQPPVPELEGTAAQNRFNLLFQKFIRVFATQEHPLVIFLDDLQWADSASLKLMQLLMNERDACYLLLIGAYRDNEVSPAHPLMLTLNEIRKAEATIGQITLAPLDKFSLNHLIADTLLCTPERAVPLTQLVLQKTQGNPFFATQFLKSLHEDGLIYFSNTGVTQHGSKGGWQCDMAKVRALAVSDDVVEFMAVQLQKLPRTTQTVLKLAACIGNQFDLNTLAIVHEKSQVETAVNLWRALQEELIIPISDVYKFFQSDGNQPESTQVQTTNYQLPIYRFLHDRVQQAAYFLIPEDQKQSTHLKIGQLLLSNTPEQEREEKIFDIVNSLNYGVELITHPTEREELAQLNLLAGRKARASTAYTAAVGYLTVGMGLLAAGSWTHQYNLTLALYEEAAEAAYLSGDYAQMDRLIEVVRNQAQILLDKVKVYEVQIQALMVQNKLKSALQTALEALSLLGVSFPEQPNLSDFQLALSETQSNLIGKRIEDLINLPRMSDPNRLAALRLLSSFIACGYIAAPEFLPLIAFKQVSLQIEYGNAAQSPFAYAMYGTILCGVVLDIESGYQFGNLALTLLEQLNAKQIQSKTLLVVHAFITHCKAHIRDALKPLQDGYQAGIENGDLEFAGYSALTHCQYCYFMGQPLSELAEKMSNYVNALEQLKQLVSVNCLKIYLQSVCNLASSCLHPGRLIGQVYDESEKLLLLQQANDRYGLFNLYTNKVILAYLFQDFYQATENGTLAENYLDGATGHAGVVILHFYTSLAWLMLYPTVASSEQVTILHKVTANQEKMKQWAHHAPMNYLHKFYLVEAERHRVLSEPIEAMDDYEQAISLAKENDYINEEALANELAAKFYLDWGKEKIAQVYLTDAYYAYARWGALAKVEDLEKRYPQLLAPILNREKSVPSAKKIAQMTTGTITSTSTGDAEILDLATVIKASQALSGEIYLDKLLSRLIQVAIENAGASKCVLVLSKAGYLAIAATGVTAIGSNSPSIAKVSVLQSMPVEESQEIPVTVINYVNRTQKILLLDDASSETMFATDPYITREQPKSVLCTPIQNQGKAIGILYLENHLTRGAFTPDRLEVLNIISSQAAISIENAQLYREVLDREKELRESERKLAQLLEAMPVGVFVADAKGKAYYINSRAQQLLGKGIIDNSTSEQLREVYQIYLAGGEQLYPQEHDPILCALQGASINIDNMEIRQPDKVIPIEVWGTPIYDEEGNVAYAIAAFQDITQRQLAERLIAEYNRTLEAQVAKRTQELKNALDHLKATQEELIQSEKMAALGQLIAGVAHEINTPLGAIRASIENITDFFANQLENLPRFLQQLSSKNQQYFFALLHQCTQTETFLSTREKRQIKRNLTQKLAEHTIKNADSVASILVDLGVGQDIEPFLPLLQDPDSSTLLEKAYQLASVRKSTKTIATATERAAKVVFALKNYARYDATGKKVQADITQGIETVLTLYQNQLKQGVQVIRNYQSSPSILCYPDELHQVWTNLIHNALQAMDNKGTITVDVAQDDASVIVRITDSGKGIPPEIKDKIFEPFFTTKNLGEGSGLGLHIVKTIIDRHEGKIEVISRPGKTTFTVSLPFNIISVSIGIN